MRRKVEGFVIYPPLESLYEKKDPKTRPITWSPPNAAIGQNRREGVPTAAAWVRLSDTIITSLSWRLGGSL